MAKSQKPAVLGTILGVGAAIGGRADVAAAVIAGGMGMGRRNFLAYSRTLEGSADQAAVRFLTATKQSAMGLVEFLRVIEDRERLAFSQSPYARTHPVTADRIDNLLDLAKASPYAASSPTPEDVIRHRRMVAKLNAFIDPIDRTIRTHKDDPNSLEARYALAIAHYRRPDLEKALKLIDGLIGDYPNDPYFRELKGQMLRENGRVVEALEPYRMSVQLDPSSALLRGAYAQPQLNTGDPALLDGAIENLDFAATREPRVSFYWRQLAIAWGRKGDRGMNSLALAEEAILKRKFKEAVFYADRPRALPKGASNICKPRISSVKRNATRTTGEGNNRFDAQCASFPNPARPPFRRFLSPAPARLENRTTSRSVVSMPARRRRTRHPNLELSVKNRHLYR